VRLRRALPPGIERFEIVDERGAALPALELERETRTLATLELEPAQLLGMLANVDAGQILDQAILAVQIELAEGEARLELVVGRHQLPDPGAIRRGRERLRQLITGGGIDRFRITIRMATEVEIELLAPGLPAFGYRSFGLRSGEGPPPSQEDGERWLENDHLRIEVEPDGRITLLDLRTGARFAHLLGLRDAGDRGDSYNFCPLDGDVPIESPSGAVRVRRVRAPTRGVLEIERALRVPAGLRADRRERSAERCELRTLTRVTVVPGVARADLEITVDNPARDHRLQLLAPLGEPLASAEYAAHFDLVRRPTAEPKGDGGWAEQPRAEQPVGGFLAGRRASDGAGLLVSAPGLREGVAEPDGTLAFTLLRSFGWLSRDDLVNRRGGAGPELETPGGQELGVHRFALALVPFSGPLSGARAEAEASALPPRAACTRIGAGSLPLACTLLRVGPDDFAVTAVKRGERGDALAVRGVNLGEQAIECEIEPAAELGLRRVRPARLDETPTGPARAARGPLRLRVEPRSLLTLLFGS
jgi:alpha-mannosidase/mannosylglycerate hydrolase